MGHRSDMLASLHKKYGITESHLERIAEASWNNGGEGIVFLDIHQINACNHVFSGTIEDEGKTFGFIIEMGDISGTHVHDWGDPEDVGTYRAPPPVLYTFVPQDDHLEIRRPEMYAVYLAWTKEPWFIEMARSYNYDRHFQPGGKIEEHYRALAAKRGLKPAVDRTVRA